MEWPIRGLDTGSTSSMRSRSRGVPAFCGFVTVDVAPLTRLFFANWTLADRPLEEVFSSEPHNSWSSTSDELGSGHAHMYVRRTTKTTTRSVTSSFSVDDSKVGIRETSDGTIGDSHRDLVTFLVPETQLQSIRTRSTGGLRVPHQAEPRSNGVHHKGPRRRGREGRQTSRHAVQCDFYHHFVGGRRGWGRGRVREGLR